MLLNILITKAAVAVFILAILIAIIFTFKKLKIRRFNSNQGRMIIIGRKKIYLYCFLSMLLSILALAIFLPPIDFIMHQEDVENAENRVFIKDRYDPEDKDFILNNSFTIKGYVERHIILGNDTVAIISNEIKGSNIENYSPVNYVYVIDNNKKLEDGTRVEIVSDAIRFVDVYVGNKLYKTILFGKYIVDMNK